MTEPEPISDIVKRVVARSASKWAKKDGTEQARQRIEEITAMALPGFVYGLRTGEPGYPTGMPPRPAEAALAALRDVYGRGWANDLDDPALRAMVRQRLEAHGKTVLEQRGLSSALAAPRAAVPARRPRPAKDD